MRKIELHRETELDSRGLREVYRERVWERYQKREREAMKQLMKKNENELEKYQRRDAWTRCQVTTL